MKIFPFFAISTLIALILGFAALAFMDVPVQQQTIREEIPKERLTVDQENIP